MSKVSNRWGFWALTPMLGALACSGKALHEVGDINSGGHAGAGDTSAGGLNGLGEAGDDGGAGRTVSSGGTGGTGGTGGVQFPSGAGSHNFGEAGSTVIELPAGAGGEAGDSGVAPVDPTLHCPACATVADDHDIRAIAADATRVVWVEFGTHDALGNYNDDGRVLARSLDGGPTTVLADSVSGPGWDGLSSNYVYVGTQSGSSLGVLRIPLAGGAPEPVQTVETATFMGLMLVAGAGAEYWSWFDGIYRIADTEGATAEPFLATQNVSGLLGDDTHLYFQDNAGEWSIPFAGGSPTLLAASGQSVGAQFNTLALSGDYLYGMETSLHADSRPGYLVRLPKTGGTWRRIAQYDSDFYFSQLAIEGDDYFVNAPSKGDVNRQILQGSLADPGSFQTLAYQHMSTSTWWGWSSWAWSRVGIFVANSDGLYLTPTK